VRRRCDWQQYRWRHRGRAERKLVNGRRIQLSVRRCDRILRALLDPCAETAGDCWSLAAPDPERRSRLTSRFGVAPSLADGTVVAVEIGAIATGFPAPPNIDVSYEALIHFDTTPAQTGVPASPNVIAASTAACGRRRAVPCG
jgi:hypothetical protein